MEQIMADFKHIIPPGMTHWQHPRFFAYFPSNAAPAAMIAEQLATSMAAQCMLWQTSPSATELEQCMVRWLRDAVGLPDTFDGVLQDTASSATLCAILTMRERTLNWEGNKKGLSEQPTLRVYASSRNASELRRAIDKDIANGLKPAGIVVCVGGTSMGASDHVREVCEIAQEYDLFTHVDAAWAGSAMICPEYRDLWDGVELADSVVFNPHKWLGASMECSAHFIKEPASLVRTMAIQPEYLKTYGKDGVVNFSEWSVQLGRRFRALKVWFLMRAYGIKGLQTMIRNHVSWSEKLAAQLSAEPDFTVTTQPILSLFTFKYSPETLADQSQSNELNRKLVTDINDDGRIYLTQEKDIAIAFETIVEVARKI